MTAWLKSALLAMAKKAGEVVGSVIVKVADKALSKKNSSLLP